MNKNIKIEEQQSKIYKKLLKLNSYNSQAIQKFIKKCASSGFGRTVQKSQALLHDSMVEKQNQINDEQFQHQKEIKSDSMEEKDDKIYEVNKKQIIEINKNAQPAIQEKQDQSTINIEEQTKIITENGNDDEDKDVKNKKRASSNINQAIFAEDKNDKKVHVYNFIHKKQQRTETVIPRKILKQQFKKNIKSELQRNMPKQSSQQIDPLQSLDKKQLQTKIQQTNNSIQIQIKSINKSVDMTRLTKRIRDNGSNSSGVLSYYKQFVNFVKNKKNQLERISSEESKQNYTKRLLKNYRNSQEQEKNSHKHKKNLDCYDLQKEKNQKTLLNLQNVVFQGEKYGRQMVSDQNKTSKDKDIKNYRSSLSKPRFQLEEISKNRKQIKVKAQNKQANSVKLLKIERTVNISDNFDKQQANVRQNPQRNRKIKQRNARKTRKRYVHSQISLNKNVGGIILPQIYHNRNQISIQTRQAQNMTRYHQQDKENEIFNDRKISCKNDENKIEAISVNSLGGHHINLGYGQIFRDKSKSRQNNSYISHNGHSSISNSMMIMNQS